MIDINKREASRNRSVERVLHLLSILEESGAPLNLTEISIKAKLQKSTVQRLLAILESYGYAERHHNRYILGPIVLPLAYSYLMSNELSHVSLPVLQELADATKETASLFVRIEHYRIVLQRVEGIHPLRYVLPMGRKLPLLMGVGKVLAAALPESELTKLIDKVGDLHYADNKIRSSQELLEEIHKVRTQGFAVSRNEREIGVSSIAAPVTNSQDEIVAAISVAGATDQLDANLDFIIQEVRRAANAISIRLSRL